MRFWVIVVLALGAVACGSAPTEITAADALEVWTGPAGECAAQAPEVATVWASDEDTLWWCGREVDGCFLEAYGAQGGAPVPAIVVRTAGQSPRVTVAHELAHWLYSCSGLGASDANHADALFQDTVEGLR